MDLYSRILGKWQYPHPRELSEGQKPWRFITFFSDRTFQLDNITGGRITGTFKGRYTITNDRIDFSEHLLSGTISIQDSALFIGDTEYMRIG